MNDQLSLPEKADPVRPISINPDQRIKDISTDLTWIDLLKGLAIIGVFFDNLLFFWLPHMDFSTSPALVEQLLTILKSAIGPFVQVFFILSGFGLTFAYLKSDHTTWSWKKWMWRRTTKILVPYEISVIFTFLLGIASIYFYGSAEVQFTWGSFLAYLTLTRNFFQQTWYLSVPLWYMPALFGLYLVFPLLIKILQMWGPWKLVLISLLVTYGSLLLGSLLGAAEGSHFNDFFTYWAFQFSIGMALAWLRVANPTKLRLMIGYKALLLGIVVILFSWILRNYVHLGEVFNDSISSVGYFLFLLNLGWFARSAVPAASSLLHALSDKSYFMYLIHWPVMAYVIAPAIHLPLHPVAAVGLICAYIPAIYFLSLIVAKPIDKLTARLNALSAVQPPRMVGTSE